MAGLRRMVLLAVALLAACYDEHEVEALAGC
jgi:hypothetical protein